MTLSVQAAGRVEIIALLWTCGRRKNPARAGSTKLKIFAYILGRVGFRGLSDMGSLRRRSHIYGRRILPVANWREWTAHIKLRFFGEGVHDKLLRYSLPLTPCTGWSALVQLAAAG
jgi:hypothetical protein